MGDFVIKPDIGAGNSLILQDQAGGAVLTTVDSGVDSASTILATKTGTETLTNKTLTDTPSIILTPTTTASAPSGAAGKLYYDSDKAALMIYTDAWAKVGQTVVAGGTETAYGSYKVHTFLASGTLTVTGASIIADILIVAGGGAGGHAHGGGGGGGGMVVLPSFSLASGTYDVVVGAGGVGTQYSSGNGPNAAALTGNDSSLLQQGISRSSADPTIAKGGGGGHGETSGDNLAGAGGSGGGGGYTSGKQAGGASNQTHNSGQVGSSHGNAGGNGGTTGAPWPGAGGGGAGAAGGNAGGGPGVGGAGLDNAYRTGSNVTYAGGGGGSTYAGGNPTPGAGGSGGGGAGGNNSGTDATSGTDGLGGGGGGNERTSANMASGGSGIVVIRYSA